MTRAVSPKDQLNMVKPMRTTSLLAFLPTEIIPLLAVLGGLALILQFTKVATALFTTCGLMIFLPVLLEPLLEMLPDWALPLIMVFILFSMIGMMFTLLIGQNAKDQMVGTLAADLVKWFLFFPFRLMAWMFRSLRR